MWDNVVFVQALRFWQAFPKLNLGLLLKVTAVSEKTEASPHDIGLIGKYVYCTRRVKMSKKGGGGLMRFFPLS